MKNLLGKSRLYWLLGALALFCGLLDACPHDVEDDGRDNELPRGKPRGISPFPTLKNIFWKQEMGCRWIGNFITAFALIPLIESLKQYCTAASPKLDP